MGLTKEQRKENLKRQGLAMIDEKRTEEENYNVLDEDHTPLWQLMVMCPEEITGFNHVLAGITLQKKTGKVALYYRFRYPDDRRSWYNMRDQKTGSVWLNPKTQEGEDVIEKFKKAMLQFVGIMQIRAGSELKKNETNYTGKETPEEVQEIIQRTGLVNMARVDTKKRTVEIVNEDDYDRLPGEEA